MSESPSTAIVMPPPYMDPANSQMKKEFRRVRQESIRQMKVCEHCGASPNAQLRNLPAEQGELSWVYWNKICHFQYSYGPPLARIIRSDRTPGNSSDMLSLSHLSFLHCSLLASTYRNQINNLLRKWNETNCIWHWNYFTINKCIYPQSLS